jgi:hypothetical protein
LLRLKRKLAVRVLTKKVNYFRVRPEHREGKILIKVEVKPKEHGRRFTLKGLWECPPLARALWEEVQDLYKPWQPVRD